MKLQKGLLIGTIVAGTRVSGNNVTQLNALGELAVDASSNIYIKDDLSLNESFLYVCDNDNKRAQRIKLT
jgi:hypothetical protein